MRTGATAVVILTLLAVIIYMYSTRAPVKVVQAPARIIVPLSDQPNVSISLEKAVSNILSPRGLTFSELQQGEIFQIGRTVSNVPYNREKPWDEQLTELLKPIPGAEFRLERGNVYIGRYVSECLRHYKLKDFNDLFGLAGASCARIHAEGK